MEPVLELVLEPVRGVVFEPVLELVLELVFEPVLELVLELVFEPVLEPVFEPVLDPPDRDGAVFPARFTGSAFNGRPITVTAPVFFRFAFLRFSTTAR